MNLLNPIEYCSKLLNNEDPFFYQNKLCAEFWSSPILLSVGTGHLIFSFCFFYLHLYFTFPPSYRRLYMLIPSSSNFLSLPSLPYPPLVCNSFRSFAYFIIQFFRLKIKNNSPYNSFFRVDSFISIHQSPFYFNCLNFSTLFYFFQKIFTLLSNILKNISILLIIKEDFLIFCRI